jgi:hypothetical protein
MTTGMPVGQRVRLTQFAFDSGTHRDTKATRAMRGIVAHKTHDKDMVAVLWDGKKTVQLYWHRFLNRASR